MTYYWHPFWLKIGRRVDEDLKQLELSYFGGMEMQNCTIVLENKLALELKSKITYDQGISEFHPRAMKIHIHAMTCT